MICYRDMTFCQFHETCERGEVCMRALTSDTLKSATTERLPICQYVDKPNCFVSKEQSNTNATPP